MATSWLRFDGRREDIFRACGLIEHRFHITSLDAARSILKQGVIRNAPDESEGLFGDYKGYFPQSGMISFFDLGDLDSNQFRHAMESCHPLMGLGPGRDLIALALQAELEVQVSQPPSLEQRKTQGRLNEMILAHGEIGVPSPVPIQHLSHARRFRQNLPLPDGSPGDMLVLKGTLSEVLDVERVRADPPHPKGAGAQAGASPGGGTPTLAPERLAQSDR